VHSFLHVHTPLFTAPPLAGRSGHSRYADNVVEMDDAVGELLHALEAAGVADNTLVHFLSDHGAGLELVDDEGQQLEGGSNGVFRGGKGQGGMEGGIRVPALFRWPGHIADGRRVDVPTSTLDLLPTLLEAAGVDVDGLGLTLDGTSILNVLEGRAETISPRVLYHYCGDDIHAARYAPEGERAVYKLYFKVSRYPDPAVQHCGRKNSHCLCYGGDVTELKTPQLFDVENDPSEAAEIPAEDPRYTRHVPVILQAVEQQRSSGIVVPSQMDDFDRVMPQPELVPWSQLGQFDGVDVDIHGLEQWLEFSQGTCPVSP